MSSKKCTAAATHASSAAFEFADQMVLYRALLLQFQTAHNFAYSNVVPYTTLLQQQFLQVLIVEKKTVKFDPPSLHVNLTLLKPILFTVAGKQTTVTTIYTSTAKYLSPGLARKIRVVVKCCEKYFAVLRL